VRDDDHGIQLVLVRDFGDEPADVVDGDGIEPAEGLIEEKKASRKNELLHDRDALVGEFIDLNVTAERAEQHAATFDFDAMQRSWQHHSKQAKAGPAADPRCVIAEQNLAVLRQRRARYDDLTRSIQVARGQMELVEQTFRLLADEILTMASPSELGGRIDELRVAVDAARETTIDPFDVIPEAELEELEVHEGHW
jgi:hypothetical protein